MVQKAVHQIDPLVVVADLRSMQAYVDESLVARRSPALLAGTFAAIALLLAAIGTFGVLGYAVSRRQREIGVRMALGAQPAQIQRRFLLAGLRLVAAGVALGFLGAWAAGRAMQGVLFDVYPMNGGALGATAAILGAIAIPACLLPARRAARVDPATVLRAE
jgi:ABC-type antimicrobial peptide transport system permease subunit